MRIVFVGLMIFSLVASAQVSKDAAVLLHTDYDKEENRITLKWQPHGNGNYQVFRKLKSENSFGTSIKVLNGSDSVFVDTTIDIGESYEYSLLKSGGGSTAYGYINSGIETDVLDIRGRLILLTDSLIYHSLTTEVERLIDDLDNEGWGVNHQVIPKSFSVEDVKNTIKTMYDLDPQNTSAVFLLGHVAVPYSGNLAPDAHPDHVGAWPCDAYYGDMDGNWTDQSINTTSANDSRNHNVPGDGKFDQNTIPGSLELQVGRVDLSDMPAFSKNEVELTRDYLNKNHAYRTNQIATVPRALIDDNFGYFNGEAFAASGWKAFSTMFGPDSIKSLDYFSTLSNQNYLWSYGCGGGSYTSAGGIGNTNNFASDSTLSVFTMLFGSYFGDWDKTNSFLRAPLAQGLTLTNIWSGRPHWYLHHMALGENIGYSQRIVANGGAYNYHYARKFVHIALMGDPTLTMYPMNPPANLQAVEEGNAVNLSWTASPQNVLGYHIYRKKDSAGVYERLTDEVIPGTQYTDTEFDDNGTFIYSVRPIKLEETPSGSFFNAGPGSQAIIETIYTGMSETVSENEVKLWPNPSEGIINISVPEGETSLIMSIYSIQGKLVERSTISVKDNQMMKKDLSHIGEGIYLVQLEGSVFTTVNKLILQ